MKIKPKMFVVSHGSYPFDILFCIDIPLDKVVAELKRLGTKLTDNEKEQLEMSGVGRTVRLLKNQTVIRVANLKDPAKFHANISHEVFHAVEFLFDSVGIKHEAEVSGEAFAYQIQHITEQIYKKLEV